METQEYFKKLEKGVREAYVVAEQARAKGLDPVDKVEIPLAMSMAEKCVGLISTIYPQMMGCGISDRILALEKEHGKLDPAVCLQIAEEVAKQKFCKFASLMEAIDAGARLGFAYITLGVVSSPIEGLTEIKIMKTKEGKDYFSPWYAGPVRSAGGTGAAFSLVIVDHLREIFGYAKYDPTEDEIKRTITELRDYHERVTNLQYFPLEQEAEFIARHIPLQVNGDPSEKLEVSNYKNLERIETNNIRSGVCLTLAEGLAQKAPKIKRYVKALREKGYKLSDWDFLDEYVELHEKLTSSKTKSKDSESVPTYMKDLVAGRPVFGHPSRSGAFRFRYGRGRVSGFSAASLHPATMAISDDFIATGTQLKIEKPTKGCVITACDLIEGPIVKLFNGSVKQIKTREEAKKIYPDVEEIIYMGDILFPFSDLANRNSTLIKPGYVEEWWYLDLNEKIEQKLNYYDLSIDEAIKFSQEYEIPLYPKYIFYWTQISLDEFKELVNWLRKSYIRGKKIVLPYGKKDQDKFEKAKRALELLGVEHEVTIENVVLSEKKTKALFLNLGIDLFLIEKENLLLGEAWSEFEIDENKTVLEIVNDLSKFKIKDKAGDFIGTRMGRPEKAKLRKLTGSPNVLFSVGNEGGRLRSVLEACNVGKVRSSFPLFYCEKCNKETIYSSCEKCGSKCSKRYYYRSTGEKSNQKQIGEEHGSFTFTYDLDTKYYLEEALNRIGMKKEELPTLIKGVRGMSSDKKIPENLAKGILRAKHELQVNKDGTIRFDATELPIVSFKPKEILVSVEKLKEIGYTHDVYGEELTRDDQILELMPHDVLLPASYESPDERADAVFIRVANFIDDLLLRFYGINPIHNIKTKEDLVGVLGVCMAPHNCAGVICRFIGFSNTQGLLASPYMHAAIRRDCDGDEAAVMLLSDVLINFSREFLPSHRGGTQDAPLVLNAKIDAGEVDDQILDFEMVYSYPIELYRLAEERKHSSEIKMKIVKRVLKEGGNPFVGIGFTHDTTNFNDGVVCSSYKKLATMQEKVQHQMELVEKIRAVDTADTARLIIERHFIRDMRGNLRKFSMQGFRCVACNESIRRPPLTGVCPVCGGKIIFTIHEGGIKKYLEPTLDLINKYNLSPYIKQSIEITKRYIDSVFGKELEKQEGLQKWF